MNLVNLRMEGMVQITFSFSFTFSPFMKWKMIETNIYIYIYIYIIVSFKLFGLALVWTKIKVEITEFIKLIPKNQYFCERKVWGQGYMGFKRKFRK